LKTSSGGKRVLTFQNQTGRFVENTKSSAVIGGGDKNSGDYDSDKDDDYYSDEDDRGSGSGSGSDSGSGRSNRSGSSSNSCSSSGSEENGGEEEDDDEEEKEEEGNDTQHQEFTLGSLVRCKKCGAGLQVVTLHDVLPEIATRVYY
jgi:hypothetical protein